MAAAGTLQPRRNSADTIPQSPPAPSTPTRGLNWKAKFALLRRRVNKALIYIIGVFVGSCFLIAATISFSNCRYTNYYASNWSTPSLLLLTAPPALAVTLAILIFLPSQFTGNFFDRIRNEERRRRAPFRMLVLEQGLGTFYTIMTTVFQFRGDGLTVTFGFLAAYMGVVRHFLRPPTDLGIYNLLIYLMFMTAYNTDSVVTVMAPTSQIVESQFHIIDVIVVVLSGVVAMALTVMLPMALEYFKPPEPYFKRTTVVTRCPV